MQRGGFRERCLPLPLFALTSATTSYITCATNRSRTRLASTRCLLQLRSPRTQTLPNPHALTTESWGDKTHTLPSTLYPLASSLFPRRVLAGSGVAGAGLGSGLGGASPLLVAHPGCVFVALLLAPRSFCGRLLLPPLASSCPLLLPLERHESK